MKSTTVLVTVLVFAACAALIFWPCPTRHDPGMTVTEPVELSGNSVSNPPAGDLSALLGGKNGQTYRLVAVNGTALDASLAPVPTVTFGPIFGEINAKFCNSMGGAYVMKDFVMKGDLVGTQMACGKPEGIMKYESQFGAMLSKGAKVTLLNGNLHIESDDGQSMAFML